MTTLDAKIALLAYCRFARQMHYVATEVAVPGGCIADVLASDGTNLMEYEVKVSMSDLSKDSEKPKHAIYDPTPITWDGNIGTKGKLVFELRSVHAWRGNRLGVYLIKGGNSDKERLVSGWNDFGTTEEAKAFADREYGKKSGTPNMLYYTIPTTMWDKYGDKITEQIGPHYGVITFSSHNYHGMTVRKKAKKLHKNPVNPDTLRTIVARMSSELASLTMAHYRYLQNMTEFGKIISDKANLGEEEEGIEIESNP